ncbi:MAG: DUF1800 domain-containing protein [Chloroflexi bacterium]|nr:DUF1800 domain-containing protein [Chloroflexota bacterium]MCI0775354.1 DUF1800 domain-containing protein [Chloroflexota bacterium]MCI0804255.1 DUF1800 domain-containing protein [Chloroflexota bacterium]MCI0834533.1 DUF1800 domain-containing protein [Chloroflexota bacterium]MCI0835704.1 DUF1800 domain-containing protein [Chloroflexota bacterium]
MTTIPARADYPLVAHLLRRAGFGGTSEDLRDFASVDYEVAVDRLLDAVDTASLPDDLIRRYHIDQSDLRTGPSAGSYWVGRMVTTDAPLVEKVALFWHRIFATAQTKLIQGKVMSTQIGMFREYGLGSFRDILVQLSKNPAMILFLDNQDNHRGAINENYGREILELFSMGVGNYTEEDVKECARAFTGWTVANTDYMAIKMRNNTMRPYGYIAWQFKYDEADHDDGEKTFLGRTGNFNGEDVIDIICEQPATAAFIARHMYHYFVADELPVPQWPHFPPKDPEAITVMTDAYFESGYNIKAMLRALFLSDSFKSDAARYARIKSPMELIVGTLRLAGGYQWPSSDVYKATAASGFMGQALLAPPSVEGWMGGSDWISTGTMVQRVNFASGIVGDLERPGIRRLVDAIKTRAAHEKEGSTPESLVGSCLELLGRLDVSDETRSDLVDFATSGKASRGPSDSESDSGPGSDEDRSIISIMQLIVATREYQLV